MNKLNLKSILLFSMLFAVFSTSVFAASDSGTFKGSRAKKNTLSIANIATSIVLPDSGGLSGVKVMDITLSNNDIDGFSLTVSSANGGKMKAWNTTTSAYVTGTEVGKSLPYTLTILDTDCTGTWARTKPNFTGYDLGSGDKVVNCNVAVTAAAEAAKADLKIDAVDANVTRLLTDVNIEYRDVLTITVADL